MEADQEPSVALWGAVTPRRILRSLPITVAVVWALAWLFASNGIRYEDVFELHLLNPATYTLTMLFHSDWAHFSGNMDLWLPAGVALTLLTSNRHVLLIIVTAHGLAQIVGIATGQLGVGFSSAALAAIAAVLVRATGIALQNASDETLQAVVAGVLTLVSTCFLLIAIFAGANTTIAHFHHFFGLLFGGAIEAMYVFQRYGEERDESASPRGYVGR